MKKIIIYTTFFCLITPFVLIKTIYPFFRFGMYAEPQNQELEEESFHIFYQKDSLLIEFDETSIGFDNSVFDYMKRNYYYRNQAGDFLRKLHTINKAQQVDQWLFVRKAAINDTIRYWAEDEKKTPSN